MLTNLKVATAMMAILFSAITVLAAFQIYTLRVQIEVLQVQIDGIKKAIDQKT
jgi:hypothetical protein